MYFFRRIRLINFLLSSTSYLTFSWYVIFSFFLFLHDMFLVSTSFLFLTKFRLFSSNILPVWYHPLRIKHMTNKRKKNKRKTLIQFDQCGIFVDKSTSLYHPIILLDDQLSNVTQIDSAPVLSFPCFPFDTIDDRTRHKKKFLFFSPFVVPFSGYDSFRFVNDIGLCLFLISEIVWVLWLSVSRQ